MPQDARGKTFVAGALVLVAAVVVVVLVWPADEQGAASAVVSSAPVERVEGESRTQPLPPDRTTVESVMAFSAGHARGWRDDAQLTRLYATGVRADGSFDRESSEVQLVYFSPEATRSHGEINGWRMTVRQGMFDGVAIWLHPAPEPDERPARWCSLRDVVGEGAPDRFTIDTHWAQRGAQAPALLVFTTTPTRWVVVADPFTCAVHDRSRPRTEQEDEEVANAPDASGVQFDARTASQRVTAKIAAAGCERDGPKGAATVQVVFGKDGRATQVDFLAGSVGDTAAGQCLRTALMGVRVKPWQQGTGRAVARFVW